MAIDEAAFKRDLNAHMGGDQMLVFYERGARWRMFIPCAACEGFFLDLAEADLQQGEAAKLKAQALAASLAENLCLGCMALGIERYTEGVSEPFMYFDPTTPGWMGCLPLGDGAAITVPLGISLIENQPLALAALSLLCQHELPAALTVAEDRGRLSQNIHAVFHEGSRWVLWWPCEQCGGAELALSTSAREQAMVAVSRALGILTENADGRCPGCEADLRREQVLDLSDGQLAYWYDPRSSDWMMALAMGEATIAMPLDVGFFDIPVSELEARVVAVAGGDDRAGE